MVFRPQDQGRGSYRKGKKTESKPITCRPAKKFSRPNTRTATGKARNSNGAATDKKTLDADYVDDQLNGKLQIWYSDGTTAGPFELRAWTWKRECSKHGTRTASSPRKSSFTMVKKAVRHANGIQDGQIRMQSRYRNGVLQGTFDPMVSRRRQTERSELCRRRKAGDADAVVRFARQTRSSRLLRTTSTAGSTACKPRTTKSGKKQLQVTARDGERQGPWAEWYENGQVKTKGVYKDDQLDGPVWFYYEDGKQWAIELLLQGRPERPLGRTRSRRQTDSAINITARACWCRMR